MRPVRLLSSCISVCVTASHRTRWRASSACSGPALRFLAALLAHAREAQQGARNSALCCLRCHVHLGRASGAIRGGRVGTTTCTVNLKQAHVRIPAHVPPNPPREPSQSAPTPPRCASPTPRSPHAHTPRAQRLVLEAHHPRTRRSREDRHHMQYDFRRGSAKPGPLCSVTCRIRTHDTTAMIYGVPAVVPCRV